jgi:hypothetical protein
MQQQQQQQVDSHWADFREILYLSVSRKSVEKIQVSLNSADKNSGHFTLRHFGHISLSSS